jgi:hypothetical protein
MSPDKKETLVAGIMTLFIVILSLFLLGAMAGCAHSKISGPQDSSIQHAAAISDRIDGKTVVITEWLKTH